MIEATTNSLVDLLELRARQDGDVCAFTFLSDEGSAEKTITCRELDYQARLLAARIMQMATPGDRALLLYPPGLEFFPAFFACLYAAVVAVPAYPPHRNRNLLRLQTIFRDAQPRLVLTTSALLPKIKDVISTLAGGADVRVIATDEAPLDSGNEYIRPRISQDTIAFLQYTSGSTANPKGIMLTHGNLLHNASLVCEAVEPAPDDSYVSWLPVFHDMGFMAGILQPLYRGRPAVLMAPAAFLERPVRWLQAISTYRATASGGPSFAYDLCVRRIPEPDREGLDLSSWSIAFNGSEPVRAAVMDRFASAFARCGFRREAFYPCYGLAEATLMVSGGRKSEPFIACEFDQRELENHLICPPRDHERIQTLVACGRNLPGQEIAIVDPDSHQRCGPDQVGEIWVRGPSVAAGYWNNLEQSEETFNALLEGTSTPFLRTGDLGFLRNEELFVTGRIKDLLIIRGQNHYPQDIELTTELCDPVLQPGSGAAFSVEAGNEERLVVVQEAANRADNDWDRMFASIRRAIAESHELAPYAIVLVRTGTIPKTSSGKIQRHACREAFSSGQLRVLKAWYEQDVRELPEPEGVSAVGPAHTSPLALKVVQEIARKTGVAPDKIDLDQSITAYGLDSLAAIELVHKFQSELGLDVRVSDLFEGVSLGELLRQVEQSSAPGLALQPQTPQADIYPLSHGQRAIWFLQQTAPSSVAYNIARAVRITSSLEVDLLHRAFQDLVDRHPALRTTFAAIDGEPLQRVHSVAKVCFVAIDATSWSRQHLAEVLSENGGKVFDLENGPLLCAYLYTRSEDDHVLQLVMHHLIADFWSLMLLLDDLGKLYRSHSERTAAALSPLNYGYADFVSWQEQIISGPEGEKLWSYWQRELSGEIASLNLPADCPRPLVSSFRGASLEFAIDSPLALKIRELGADRQATLFMALLAAFQVLLHRLTGQPQFAVGVPTSGRSRAEFSDLVGYFVNVLPLLADFREPQTFKEALIGARRRAIDAFAHDAYPFPLIVERLGIQRSFNSSPIFQTMFVFQKAYAPRSTDFVALAMGGPGAHLDVGGLEMETFPFAEQAAQFDLTLTMGEGKEGLVGTWQYSTDLFDPATIIRWNQSFLKLLKGIVADPGMLVNELPIIPEDQSAQLLFEFNRTEMEFDQRRLVHDLISHQAMLAAGRTAVAHETSQLTYRDLNIRADQVADYLCSRGVGSEDLVGICMTRSPAMIVAMLGAWKAGAAYVPLDPRYPQERLRFMLEDSGAKAVITEEALREKVEGAAAWTVTLDETANFVAPNSAPAATSGASDQLAYVIYTSGSTGVPKGVMLTHGNILSFVAWARNTFSREEFSGVLATTSICFDLSIFELWATLSCGGTVILAEDILQWCDSSSAAECQPPVRLINTVPSAMEKLLECPLPASVRTVNLAGEALHEGLVRKIYEAGAVERVNNLYGPTETTTYSSWATASAEIPVTIGRGIANTQLYVLDRDHQLAPLGVVGELYIGGAGVARGYWRHPDWTAERFVPNPCGRVPGERIFRTGDLVRWQADGQLLYLGRSDQQVKLRGFRIELGEISVALGQWDAIRENAVVVFQDGGEKQLVAYVALRADVDLTPQQIRDYLRRRLPEYMVPNHIVLLPDLPKTSSGKVDRKALPQPHRSMAPGGRMPASQMEREIAAVWREVLKVEEVGAEDDFFLLGGHSLLMMQIKARLEARLHRNVSLAQLLQSPTVAGMAKAIEPASALRLLPPVVRIAQDGPMDLSFAQERIWFLEQMNPGLPVYNVAGAVRLKGVLNKQAVQESLQEIVRRHAALRTAFVVVEGKPLQQVHETVEFELEQTDLRSVPYAGEIEVQLNSILTQEAKQPFSLSRAGLVRARLIQTAERNCTLIVVLHHIIADGWSIGVLLRELEELYAAHCAGRPPSLPPLNFQFADYAVWQRRLLQSGDMDEGLAYWKEQLSGAAPVLDLPLDNPRPAHPGHDGSVVRFSLGRELNGKLGELCHREAITPYVLLLAGFQVLLSRYSCQTDLIVGSPLADRQQVECEKLVGLFANLLPLRAKVDGEESFLSLLKQLKQTVAQAQAWQHIPFEKIVEQAETDRGLSHMPLVQVVFAWQIGLMGSVRLGQIFTQPQIVHTDTSKFDLMLTIEEGEDSELVAWIEYSTEIFVEKTAQQLATRYVRLVEQAVSDPAQLIGDLSLLDENERKQILTVWNGVPLQPQPGCVHSWFEQQARHRPEAIAVIADGRSLNYRDLNAVANQVARALIARGIGPEMVVGICLERSEWMIVTILAVLKAGAAYLPLDPAYPPERLAYMLKDAGAAFILTEKAAAEKLSTAAVPALLFDDGREWWQAESTDNPEGRARESNLAYIIYTSGSTGQPKGVMVQHGNLSGLLSAADTHFRFQPEDRWTLFHLYSFDFSVWEIWGALAYGGTLIIVPPAARRSPRDLSQLIREQKISILSQVPSAFYQLLDYEEQAGEPVHLDLRAIVFGGEALDVKRLESWIKRHGEHGPLLVNMYGITETTIHVTYKPLHAGDIAAGRSVIGSPLSGYRTFLLDRRQMLLPPGVPGEIYVGGIGVARGYLNRPDLTAERFVPDPLVNEPGARLYRTGDLGRYLSDGTIEYLGRLDHQVKIRGYRIELGEIESTLKRHAAIHDCAVLAKAEAAGDQRLVAYIVADLGSVRSVELRAYLRLELPEYMVPAQFFFVERLPLTPNGKIDRKQLLQLESSSGVAGVPSQLLDPTEELIAGIWSSLLGAKDFSAESNFFDLGGHSLLATQMVLRLRQVFGCDVPLRSIFEFSTLHELAAHIRNLTQAPGLAMPASIPKGTEDSKKLLSSGQERLWFLDQFAGSSYAYNIAGAARLKGELNADALRRSFQTIILRHEILRAGFVEQQGRPQQIAVQVQFNLETRDLTEHAHPEEELAVELKLESAREFVLSEPPLLRAVLFRLGEQEHVLMVAMHHIIADAWSIEIMIRELAQLYASYDLGTECTLPELPFQYADYAAWEHGRWAQGDFNSGLDYWRKQLAGASRVELPADFAREAEPSYRGQMLKTVLDSDLCLRMKELCRRENVTLFMLLLTGFQALLSQYTGEEDVVVGASIANRNHSGTENLIGLFTNEVVLRAQLSGDPGFHELLSRMREVTLSAYTHQDLPFGKLVEALQPQRDFSRNPFFQATVLLQNDPLPQREFGRLSLEPVELDIESAIFDLSLAFTPGADDQIHVSLRHSARFRTERMQGLLRDLVAVFRFIVANPEGRVSQLKQVLIAGIYVEVPASPAVVDVRSWSDPALNAHSIKALFEQQVLATPSHIAVRYEQQQLTFAELNEKANRVANHMLQLGVRNEDCVALCLERSPQILVAILGILKTGAAYLPLDRTYPVQRLKYILTETAAAAILTQHSLASLFTSSSCDVVCMEDASLAESSPENPSVVVHPDNLAYVIYTSGSTGTPKGVMVQHRSVVNLLQGLERTVYSDLDGPVCVSINAPVVFDASVKQWVRLLKGNTVCILPEEKRFDPEALISHVNEQNIDVLDCTPSVLRLMLNHATLRNAGSVPRAMLIGGEPIDTPIWERLREQEQIAFYNVYGPTECTVDVSVCKISGSSQPSIGRPINNVDVYILNSSLQPVSPGQIGELYVAGAGLARGYCNRPDLTAERFIPDAISGVAGSRLYRTGDLARLLPDGQLEFCGRRDDQVKIRGYRVELEEITSVLRRAEGVRDAVVLMTGENSGQARLLAYVVPEPSTTLNPEQLRDHVRQHLPEYMTPSGFVLLDELPVTVNGKIDRKALMLGSDGLRAIASTYAPARNRMEEVVTAIWQEVLGLRQAGIHDNFFDLGGHSLAMVQVRSRLREVLNKEVPMVELFRNPTIALLARYLEGGQTRPPSLQLAHARAGKRIAAANRVGKP